MLPRYHTEGVMTASVQEVQNGGILRFSENISLTSDVTRLTCQRKRREVDGCCRGL